MSSGTYSAITSEGGLIPLDLLDEIGTGEAPHQHAKDFHLDGRLADEIQNAFADARAYWEVFTRRRERTSCSLATVTRDIWVEPLLKLLGYVDLVKAETPIGTETFAISHRAGSEEHAPPVHIVSIDQVLDERGSHRRRTPHAAVQELLNRTDALWGIVTNGARLRLLRDSAKLVKPSYLEFDLQGMIESGLYNEFAVFYRLVHRSRLPDDTATAAESPIEALYQSGEKRGGRVREKLRDGVEEAIEALGAGFLDPKSGDGAIRAAYEAGELTDQAYYRELLRLVYRLLFLMVAEERRLVKDPDASDGVFRRYDDYYSVTRLRNLSEQPAYRAKAQAGYGDLWPGLVQTFRFFGDAAAAHLAGVTHLNGDLFSDKACPHLEGAAISNGALLTAMGRLNRDRDEGEKVRGRRRSRAGAVWRRVNYAALDVEELGSVYESLLDLQPEVDLEHGSFSFGKSNERKSSGSYYTPLGLVGELVKSALDPVIAERLAAVGQNATIAQREAALLEIKVCDPAAGSGHFLLAAARRLGRELARVRSEGNEPGADSYRAATRDVIAHCVYGVDLNPLAVELRKVALWLEAHEPGKPLGFLDHRIRHGNSLIGAAPDFDPATAVIPDDAYKEVTGDDKAVAKAARDKNRAERKRLEHEGKGNVPLFEVTEVSTSEQLRAYFTRMAHAEASVEEVAAKEATYRQRQVDVLLATRRLRADLWTAAYFWPHVKGEETAPTTAFIREAAANQTLWHYIDRRKNEELKASATYRTIKLARAIAREVKAFHWALEFEDVFNREDPGFDCILGNPPWERIKLQEQEFFASRSTEIATARNKAARERLIKALVTGTEPWQRHLHADFETAKRISERESMFLRLSGRNPLTGRGDINTYSVFAELASSVIRTSGRAGVIVPTGIATDDTNKTFFGTMVEDGKLASLFDFENSEGVFAGVHRSYKFSLLVLAGRLGMKRPIEVGFFLTQPEQVSDPERRFTLTADEIALLNPNTKTCPIFRTRRDAEITKAIYQRAPVLIREDDPDGNPWGVTFKRMFDMSNDSHLFRTREQLEGAGYRRGDGSNGAASNVYVRGGEAMLPLYEAKLIHQYDHRFATYDGDSTRNFTLDEHQRPSVLPIPRYWVSEGDVNQAWGDKQREWYLVYRKIARNTDERTLIYEVLPSSGAGDSICICTPESATQAALLESLFNSVVVDFAGRQKSGGANVSFFVVKQLPVLPPSTYTPELLDQIVPRVLELTYTAWDLQPFARDLGYEGEPFRWDEERRLRLRSELDGIYAHLYTLSRDDFAYILDTFPIVRRNDEKRYGEFRSKRLCLDAYDWYAPETLRTTEADIKGVELALRELIETTFGPGLAAIPDELRQKLLERQREHLRGAVSEAHASSLGSVLQSAYLVDLQRIILADGNWPRLETRFGSKGQLKDAFYALNELRNALAHTRAIDEPSRRKGEAGLTWFKERLDGPGDH